VQIWYRLVSDSGVGYSKPETGVGLHVSEITTTLIIFVVGQQCNYCQNGCPVFNISIIVCHVFISGNRNFLSRRIWNENRCQIWRWFQSRVSGAHGHRRWKRGAGGTRPPPKKNLKKYFLVSYHVKFRHFVNFSCIYSQTKKYCPPLPNLTELLRLCPRSK